jgi:hypothetical protein
VADADRQRDAKGCSSRTGRVHGEQLPPMTILFEPYRELLPLVAIAAHLKAVHPWRQLPNTHCDFKSADVLPQFSVAARRRSSGCVRILDLHFVLTGFRTRW